jgi:hypothetical protein
MHFCANNKLETRAKRESSCQGSELSKKSHNFTDTIQSCHAGAEKAID